MHSAQEMQNMKNLAKSLGISTLVLGGAMGATVIAQAPADQQSAPAAQSAPATQSGDTNSSASSAANANPTDSGTYATGKPLAGQSNEGFWGHMNPFARKKWVRRQVDPIRDRTNELDQLQAKNANDIKDVDSRAQAGINKAMMAANTADQHASDASNRANSAQTTATGASSRAESLNGTVSNLDQYKQVSSVDVKFPRGSRVLGKEGKDDLQQLAQQLASEKGYIIEIQGYSRAGLQSSQAMADSVARYLVTEQQVPLYRIYRSGMGKAPKNATSANSTDQAAQTTTDEKPLVNGVRVVLLHNSLASLGGSDTSNPAMQQQNQQSPGTMSQPSTQPSTQPSGMTPNP
jgi:outer membrane protein OmpA-like peptidoglycan-associated protein